MERAAFLARTRERLLGVSGPELPGSFPPTPSSGTDTSPERFLSALRAVNGEGALVSHGALVDAIETALRAGPSSPEKDMKKSVVIASDASMFDAEIDAAVARAGLDAVRPATGVEWRTQASRAALGITSAVLGVASTGSVLIGSGADSPRAASILPEAHLVILPADRLVAGLEQALETVAAMASTHSAPFLVTGPSRTSDIEMEMVLGAHGPRRLHVLLVETRPSLAGLDRERTGADETTTMANGPQRKDRPVHPTDPRGH
jgi:L-lactate dehydrogenase complex protein LldG